MDEMQIIQTLNIAGEQNMVVSIKCLGTGEILYAYVSMPSTNPFDDEDDVDVFSCIFCDKIEKGDHTLYKVNSKTGDMNISDIEEVTIVDYFKNSFEGLILYAKQNASLIEVKGEKFVRSGYVLGFDSFAGMINLLVPDEDDGDQFTEIIININYVITVAIKDNQ